MQARAKHTARAGRYSTLHMQARAKHTAHAGRHSSLHMQARAKHTAHAGRHKYTAHAGKSKAHCTCRQLIRPRPTIPASAKKQGEANKQLLFVPCTNIQQGTMHASDTVCSLHKYAKRKYARIRYKWKELCTHQYTKRNYARIRYLVFPAQICKKELSTHQIPWSSSTMSSQGICRLPIARSILLIYRVGQNRVYTVCICFFGREITKYTVIYGVYIRFRPTLLIKNTVLHAE